MGKQGIEQHKRLPKPGFQNVEFGNRLRFEVDFFILAALPAFLFVLAGTGFGYAFSLRHRTGMHLNAQPEGAGEHGEGQK